jgi:hypothetical protein
MEASLLLDIHNFRRKWKHSGINLIIPFFFVNVNKLERLFVASSLARSKVALTGLVQFHTTLFCPFVSDVDKVFTNGRGSAVNIALDSTIYPGKKPVPSSLCKKILSC